MFIRNQSKKSRAISYLTIALGLGFTVNLNADQYYYNQNYNPNYRYSYADNDQMDPNTAAGDQELAKRIQDKINSGWFSKRYGGVTAKVVNGNVTLQGNVKTWDDKTKLEEEVRNMKGVAGLNSQVSVQERNSMERERKFPQDRASNPMDDQLNKKIRDNISSGWLWTSYKEVSLSTNNGVVTLEGIVDDLGDQQELMNEIQKIEGVKSVKSNLRIKNQSQNMQNMQNRNY